MITRILHMFGRDTKPSSDFSAFFVDSKARDKKKLIKEVVKKANEDQKKLVNRVEREYAKAAH